QLQAGGLQTQVQSWLGNGANLPVSPDQLRAALGSDQVRQLAEQFGVPIDAALKLLSEHLPAAGDQASPDGQIHSRRLVGAGTSRRAAPCRVARRHGASSRARYAL